MIINPTYIKQILNTDVNDSVINYLIKHVFTNVCNEVQLDTSLEEEEIATVPHTPTENPNILEDQITLFQETIIYGVACDLINIKEQAIEIPQYLLNYYSNKVEEITFCNLYDYCLRELNDYLNSVSTVNYVRSLLFLDNRVSDEDLAFLIEYYTEFLCSKLPEDSEVDTNAWIFKQALYTQIACHIFKLKPNFIGSPKSYKVDEVRVTWTVNFDKKGNTWCDLAEEAFADLKKHYYGLYGFYAFDRPGARTKYGYHGPTSRR